MTKRDVSNANKTIANEVAENGKKEKTVSDNISLFQSLRVLQEGESDEFTSSIQSNYNNYLLFFFILFSSWICLLWKIYSILLVFMLVGDGCVRAYNFDWANDIQSIRAALSCVKGQLMKCHRARWNFLKFFYNFFHFQFLFFFSNFFRWKNRCQRAKWNMHENDGIVIIYVRYIYSIRHFNCVTLDDMHQIALPQRFRPNA